MSAGLFDAVPGLIYSSARCDFYLGDCIGILPGLEPADLLVTDPPYGIAYKSGRGSSRAIAGDESTDLAEAALELAKIKMRRHVYVFWSPKVQRPTVGRLQEWMPLIWDKTSVGMGGHGRWGYAHEEILFSSRQAPGAKASGYGKQAARLRRGGVIRCGRMQYQQKPKHPTEKPVPLLRDLVESSSHAGEVVLDPFAGVGSTCVAAILEGRRAVGIELDPAYAAIAVERIKRAELVADSWAGI